MAFRAPLVASSSRVAKSLLPDRLTVLGVEVHVGSIPQYIEAMGEALRTNLGDASGADALEVIGVSWERRAILPGEQETPTPAVAHPLELRKRAERAAEVLQVEVSSEHVPQPLLAFLTQPEEEPHSRPGIAPFDMPADERRFLKLSAKAAASAVSRALQFLPSKVTKPAGPVAVSSELRRSAACWAANARAKDMMGFREYLNTQRKQAERCAVASCLDPWPPKERSCDPYCKPALLLQARAAIATRSS